MQLPLEVTQPLLSQVRTENISSRGVYFLLEGEVEAGAPIRFRLLFPEKMLPTHQLAVACQGRVVRVDKQAAAGPPPAGPPQPRVGVAAVIERCEFETVPV